MKFVMTVLIRLLFIVMLIISSNGCLMFNSFKLYSKQIDNIVIANDLENQINNYFKYKDQYIKGSLSKNIMDSIDSLMLNTVIKLDIGNSLQTNIRKYFAAVVYYHCENILLIENSKKYGRSITLCKEILQSNGNEYLQDTLSLKKFRDLLSEIEIFKSVFFSKSLVDTIYNYLHQDTFLIIKRPLKDDVNGLMYLCQTQIQETESRNSRLIVNRVDDLNFKKQAKEILRHNLPCKLNGKTIYFFYTEEEIDKLVDHLSDKIMIYKQSLLDELKNKYRNNE